VKNGENPRFRWGGGMSTSLIVLTLMLHHFVGSILVCNELLVLYLYFHHGLLFSSRLFQGDAYTLSKIINDRRCRCTISYWKWWKWRQTAPTTIQLFLDHKPMYPNREFIFDDFMARSKGLVARCTGHSAGPTTINQDLLDFLHFPGILPRKTHGSVMIQTEMQ
jgi:hypothetical protein